MVDRKQGKAMLWTHHGVSQIGDGWKGIGGIEDSVSIVGDASTVRWCTPFPAHYCSFSNWDTGRKVVKTMDIGLHINYKKNVHGFLLVSHTVFKKKCYVKVSRQNNFSYMQHYCNHQPKMHLSYIYKSEVYQQNCILQLLNFFNGYIKTLSKIFFASGKSN